MTFDFSEFVLLGLLTTALHWILARSEIARPLWSRVGGVMGALMRCPACTGFWLGIGAGAAGIRPAEGLYPLVEIGASGLLAVFATPVFEAILLWGLSVSAIEDPTPPQEPPAQP